MKIQITAIFLVALTVAGWGFVWAAAPAGASDKGKPAPASPPAAKAPAPAPTPSVAKPNPARSPAPNQRQPPLRRHRRSRRRRRLPPRTSWSRCKSAPAKFVLQGKWSSQMLVVIGRFADGSTRDVTSAAEYKSNNGQIAAVGKDGIVQPVADGEAVISITAKSADTSAMRRRGPR